MSFIDEKIPFSSLTCPFSVIMKLIEADTHGVVSEEDDSLDGRVAVLIVEALCLDFVDEIGSFGKVFHFHVPSVDSGGGSDLDLDFPLVLHELVDKLASLTVA